MDSYLGLKTHGLQAGRESAPATSALLDSEVKASVEDLWNNMRTNKSSPPLGRLTAICLDRVRIAVTHTNSPGSVFNGPVAQGFTIARSSINPGFTYRPLSQGTEELLRGGSFVLISFTARSDSSTNSGPVYLSLWWSESDKDWAPERLFTDGLLNTEVFF